MDDEVCYELLRPAQAMARRKGYPLSDVPVGSSELHDLHNP